MAERARATGIDAAVVVGDRDVVFGLLRAGELAGDPDTCIEDAMRPAPSTFRPHVPAAEMATFMTGHDLVSAPITRSDGTLIGLLIRDDVMTYLPVRELKAASHD